MATESGRRLGHLAESIPGIGKHFEKKRREKEEWKKRYEQWDNDYFSWIRFNDGKSNYARLTHDLEKQFPLHPFSVSNRLFAQERVSLERFCDLGVAIPREGLSREQLTEMGFLFPPPLVEMVQPPGKAWVVRYPEDWTVQPTNPNRFDSTGTRDATVYDEKKQGRITIFWQHNEEKFIVRTLPYSD